MMIPVIRTSQPNDVDKIAVIEQQVQIHPWSKEQFISCLKAGNQIFVLEVGQELIGYGVLSIIPPEAELLLIAISPTYQQQGYGQLLLNYILQKAGRERITRFFLEVRRSNLAAINCYEKCGFKKIAERKNYYKNDDALIYRKSLENDN